MTMTSPIAPDTDCHRVSAVLSRVGDKWTMQVIVSLREHPWRFNELKRHVGGISQQMLTRTLRMLERDGMVSRTVTPSTPPQVEYALTDLGHALSEPVRQLAMWVVGNLDTIEENRRLYDSVHRS
ncbi:winged helix-turn-helix transcriptional regulator [Jiella mangrovi]|uniref:Helix-turn-helix transcriptional regulator n=1 Tax=Jiella mangrovi TaxID=2821407 RepID=A0ABS4BM49_9HYPH|nr:helix-turn-helix domain-containing protein [Jiella mangrovi]MBP0617755.1 helix-turn-helix transcriptional regulator [Jiella mangrovi]